MSKRDSSSYRILGEGSRQKLDHCEYGDGETKNQVRGKHEDIETEEYQEVEGREDQENIKIIGELTEQQKGLEKSKEIEADSSIYQ